jgi:glycogen debranching enzyme
MRLLGNERCTAAWYGRWETPAERWIDQAGAVTVPDVALRQPFLHDAAVALRAPSQVWSRPDGDIASGVEGLVVSDVRVLSTRLLTVAGSGVEPVDVAALGADHLVFTALLRGLDGPGADPRVELVVDRLVTTDGVRETLSVRSGRDVPVTAALRLELGSDLASLDTVKRGGRGEPAAMTQDGGALLHWGDDTVHAVLTARDAAVETTTTGAVLTWRLQVPPHATASAAWSVVASDAAAVVAAPAATVPLTPPPAADPRLAAWLAVALADLEALQLALPDSPADVFLAAGAPWFFTLFGRDSIWAARMLLPIDVRLAEGTLRTLARLQGARTDPATAEAPGKIVHELRRGELLVDEGTSLPPRYYGTVDATALWVLLLHDAWRHGLADGVVGELLPNLRAALGWLRDSAAATGFLSYRDESGHGLANQGWKDSGDSIQWRDGRLAEGPIALCEVQGYAHEAAEAGAVLLDAFGDAAGADEWRAWAADLKARFRDAFWIEDAEGGYPAIALDVAGEPVDTLTSNIGHLLGTGILGSADESRVAALLAEPRLASGFGVRTMATDSTGYWPLSYHGGSVWAHDSAIVIGGLARSGHDDVARRLAADLLDAAAAFGYRMPELFGGTTKGPRPGSAPIPYPASCRPQAWAAAAAVVVAGVLEP